MPNAMDYQDFRKNLAAVMQRVVDDCDVTIITRRGQGRGAHAPG